MSTKIFDKPVGINKKIDKTMFRNGFDDATKARAEKIVIEKEGAFKQAVTSDYTNLKTYFTSLNAGKLTAEEFAKLYELAFTIKSRAGNAGLQIVSDVANSMFKFCDAAAKANPPESYDVIKLHYNALNEIFTGKFPKEDPAKSSKLIVGLNTLTSKILKK